MYISIQPDSSAVTTDTEHRWQDLVLLFNRAFRESYHTELVRGKEEPLYRPIAAGRPYHQVIFAHGFYASALHEISHWCIAGKRRRELEDYGYWYVPDGRNANQQAEFEKVEVKPQALEWIFALAAGYQFRVSVDNLGGATTAPAPFKRAIHRQVQDYWRGGLPVRAEIFKQTLLTFYGRKISSADFSLDRLG